MAGMNATLVPDLEVGRKKATGGAVRCRQTTITRPEAGNPTLEAPNNRPRASSRHARHLPPGRALAHREPELPQTVVGYFRAPGATASLYT
jgi:hypothetical protein